MSSRRSQYEADGLTYIVDWDAEGRPVQVIVSREGRRCDGYAVLTWDHHPTPELRYSGSTIEEALSTLAVALAGYIAGQRGAACFGGGDE